MRDVGILHNTIHDFFAIFFFFVLIVYILQNLAKCQYKENYETTELKHYMDTVFVYTALPIGSKRSLFANSLK